MQSEMAFYYSKINKHSIYFFIRKVHFFEQFFYSEFNDFVSFISMTISIEYRLEN